MITKAKESDVIQIMEIIALTIAEMKSYNNTQWDENYPQAKDFLEDIRNEELYLIKDNEIIKGFICVNYVEPKEYKDLTWASNEKCMVIHRMAVNSEYRRMGIGKQLMKFTESLAKENNVNYIKTDTNSANKNMRALFEKYEYEYRGEVNFPDDETMFYCYDKIIAIK